MNIHIAWKVSFKFLPLFPLQNCRMSIVLFGNLPFFVVSYLIVLPDCHGAINNGHQPNDAKIEIRN